MMKKENPNYKEHSELADALNHIIHKAVFRNIKRWEVHGKNTDISRAFYAGYALKQKLEGVLEEPAYRNILEFEKDLFNLYADAKDGFRHRSQIYNEAHRIMTKYDRIWNLCEDDSLL